MFSTGLSELNIFRGTYRECMNKETRDMTIYLAWDTQEIFVGNKRGVKVKYGGSRSIQTEMDKYFSEFRNEIYNDVKDYSNVIVDAKLEEFTKEYRETLSKLESEIIQTLKEYINNVFTADLDEIKVKVSDNENEILQIKRDINNNTTSLNTSINELSDKINETSDKVYSIETSIGTLQGDISSLNSIIGSLSTTINNINTSLTNEISLVREDVNTNTVSINKINNDITSINNKLESFKPEGIEDKIDNIDERVKSLETESIAVTAQILTNTGNINELTTEIESLKEKVNDPVIVDIKHITYMDGESLKQTVNGLSNKDEFIPTLCINTSSDRRYLRGTLYYYNPDKGDILAASSGGSSSERTPVDVGFSINDNLSSRYPISSEMLSQTITVSITRPELLSNAVFKNSVGTSFNLTLDKSVMTDTVSLSRLTTKTYTASVEGTLSKTEDDDHTYTANKKTVTVTIYQPTLFGNKGSFISNDGQTGSFTASITPGQNVYFYSPSAIKSMKSGGFDVGYTYNGQLTVDFNVNGVSNLKYHEYVIPGVNDTTITVDIS